MAYSKTRKSGNRMAGSDAKPTPSQGPSQVQRPVDSSTSQFYELEAAEVVDIILDDTHPDFQEWQDIGKAKLRLVVSENEDIKEDLVWYKNLDTNIKEFPLIGEYVIASEYMGRLFYSQKINVNGSVNNNCLFHWTKGTKLDHGFLTSPETDDYEESQAAGSTKDDSEEYAPGDLFIENILIPPLRPFEGHTMFNGRFGQSIRFGSRARLEDQDGFQEKAGSDPYDSPHILIRTAPLIDAEANGNDVSQFFTHPNIPVEEDINDDGSSIYLTTQEDVPLTIATADSGVTPFTSIEQPEAYDGKQVIINSDRIVFNTKQNQFMCFSKGEQYFHTDSIFAVDAVGEIKFNNIENIDFKTEKDYLVASQGSVNIDGTSGINFGDSKGELLAKGETLQSILEELIDAIKNTISPAAAVAGPYPVSLTNPAFLDAVKAKLNTMLSDRVTTI